MKSKISKILGVLLTLVLLGGLTAGLAVPVAAAPEAWSPYGPWSALNPFMAGPGGIVQGPGPMEKAIDGTLYAYIDTGLGPGGTPIGSTLKKSEDGGHGWRGCSNLTDDLPGYIAGPGTGVQILSIACSPNDAKRLYLLTVDPITGLNDVYRSTDAGATFQRLVQPDQTGVLLNLGSASCLTVGYNGGNHFLYLGGINDNTGWADVFMLQDTFGSPWTSTDFDALQHFTVYAVACSPNFDTEAQPQVVAVSDGWNVFGPLSVRCFVNCQYGGGAWTTDAVNDPIVATASINELTENGLTPFTVGIASADIAFPANYDSNPLAMDFFVGVSVPGGFIFGDVYEIVGGNDIDLNIQATGTGTDVTSLAVAGSTGSCHLIAAGPTYAPWPAVGAQNDIWHSEDNGLSWDASRKDVVCQTPSPGGWPAPGYPLPNYKYVVMDDDYLNNKTAVVATWTNVPMDEASVAQTTDFGESWTDIGSINTNVFQVFNLEVSPDYNNDSVLFVITGAAAGPALDSLWKWQAPNWIRVATMPIPNANTAMVQCSPAYATDGAVFLADTLASQIFRADDGGTWFKPQVSGVPPLFNGAMLVINSTNLVVGAGAGTGGNIVLTQNNGITWLPMLPAGPPVTPPFVSFAMSPDGSVLLAGDSAGNVYQSMDGGLNWMPATPPGVGIPGTGPGVPAPTNVAFDADYANNGYIYAAVGAGFNAVFRIKTGPGGDPAWSRIDSNTATTWPAASTAGGVFNANPFVPGIQPAPDGTLYVADASNVGGVPGAAPDAFSIIDSVGGDNGNLTIASGAVTVTAIGTATIAPVLPVPGPPAATWTGGAGAVAAWVSFAPGDGILVTATAPNASGSWSQGGPTTGAVITSDVDGDAAAILNWIPVSGTFSLPDAGGAPGTVGAAPVALRSINPTLDPTSTFGPFFEPMATGFGGVAANMVGLWCAPGSNTLFALESAPGPGNNLWTYTDNLTVAPTLSSPADGTDTGRVSSALLNWDALPNCPMYEIWVAPNPEFAGAGAFFSNINSFMVPGLDDGITYYWKVCSAASTYPVPNTGRALSPWSEAFNFTTGLAAAEWNPFSDAENVAPAPGATGVPLSPAFQWNPADWATGYEFVLADNAAFSSPLADETVSAPVYLYDGTLAYSTTYYWKVRAVSATSESVWATGTFTTMDEPAPPPAVTTVPPPVIETTEITPAWIWAIVIIGAVLVIAVIVLIVTTRRVP